MIKKLFKPRPKRKVAFYSGSWLGLGLIALIAMSFSEEMMGMLPVGVTAQIDALKSKIV